MKKLGYLLPVFLILAACSPKVKPVVQTAPVVPQLMSFKDSVSYVLGNGNAKQLNSVLPEAAEAIFDKEKYMLGLKEGFGEESKISEEESGKLIQRFQKEMQRMAEEETKIKAMKAKEVGEKFLTANGMKEGVLTTASGLQYKVLKEGTGATPTTKDQVEVHYEGRLIDGTVFDSSYKTGKPAQFGVTQVISGWTEGLQLMKEGAKYQFYIPAKLAYGDNAPPSIGPGQTLIFDVELLSIK